MSKPSEVRLQLLRCPHGQFALSVADANGDGSTRITNGKHCGRWNTVETWIVDADEAVEAIRKEQR